jgi:hypothetical protein
MSRGEQNFPQHKDGFLSAQEDLVMSAAQKLLLELKAHQAVVELQNEELCKTVAELDRSKAQYADFMIWPQWALLRSTMPI